MSDMTQSNYKNHWHEEEINLKRSNSDDKLGITITGGIDKPYGHYRFTSIIITHIFENGLANRSHQLKLYDIILRINNIDLTNMKHQDVLDTLKTAKENVQLLIRRLSPPISECIELEHNGKLGIRIVGGLGNEDFEKDPGIFIKNIDEDQTNNQLDIGDRLLQISSMGKTYDLRFVTHEYARKYIELACKESPKIKLYVGRTKHIIQVQREICVVHQGQHALHDSNDEDTLHVNQTKYLIVTARNQHIQTEDLNENRQTTDTMLNKRCVNNRREQRPIVAFDFEDYQRHENCGKVFNNLLSDGQCINRSKLLPVLKREQPQTHVIKFMKINENSYTLGVLFLQQEYSLTTASTIKAVTTDERVSTDVKQLNADQQSYGTPV